MAQAKARKTSSMAFVAAAVFLLFGAMEDEYRCDWSVFLQGDSGRSRFVCSLSNPQSLCEWKELKVVICEDVVDTGCPSRMGRCDFYSNKCRRPRRSTCENLHRAHDGGQHMTALKRLVIMMDWASNIKSSKAALCWYREPLCRHLSVCSYSHCVVVSYQGVLDPSLQDLSSFIAVSHAKRTS